MPTAGTNSRMKKLNIGVVGYGFMGRTHSNAFLKVANFFDVPYQPVLKTICARNAERANAFAAKWGYESVETDWRKLVESPDIDLVLVDIMMPGMDGYATMREMRKLPKGGELPLVAFTARVEAGERQRCIDAGASSYVPKPVDTEQLLTVLGEWLPAARAVDPSA